VIGDVTWTTLGRTSADSLPLGNGDLAANVWTDPDGDILFYLAKTDAWDHLGRLIKIGRLRVSLKPDLLDRGNFEQRLSLEDSSIVITNGVTTVRLWCDAHWPRMVVEVTSARPCEVRVRLDPWRSQDRMLNGQEANSANGINGGPVKLVASADHVVPKLRDGFAWYQRNESSIWSRTLELQSLSDVEGAAPDPLLQRTFGGYISGPGFRRKGRDGLVSDPKSRSASFTVTVHCQQTATVNEWVEQITSRADEGSVPSIKNAWVDHEIWWRNFWSRSHIRIESRADDWGHAAKITQHAAWHRYLVACCGRGRYPVKFNGGLFTADWGLEGEAFDGDYRRWGGGYWWQNTRLIYWSLLANGDFDFMCPLVAMYREILPLAEHRSQKWFGHGGAFFSETQYFWGAHLPTNYGWDREDKEPADVENRYIRRCWISGLELVAMMFETYQHTGDDALLENDLLPIARAVLKFYTLHYPHDSAGRLQIAPAQALETWWEAENPMPEVAGLHYLLPRLLSLPSSVLQVSDLGAWRALSARLPRLPMGTKDGQLLLLAAEHHELVPHNSENPELYAVFPFKLFGVGRTDLNLGRATFNRRLFSDTGGWRQDAIQAALLGLPEPAAYYVTKNFTEGHHPHIRFEGFWGPNYDWVPDFDHGSVGQLALQSMLVQVVGQRIYLFPAWPENRWNVSFRLHLPHQTQLECELRDGRIERLEVTPESRRRDVVILLDQDKQKAAELPASFPT